MDSKKIIRAWKDAAYRASLTDAERAQLPENPAGLVEISDAQLGELSGGAKTIGTHYIVCGTALCPTKFTCSGTLCEPIKW